MFTRSAACGFVLFGLCAAAGAQPRYHHARAMHVYASPYEADYPGAIVARRTAEAQHEPGLTSELAPDSRQTASGGPVGGVPGFDGY